MKTLAEGGGYQVVRDGDRVLFLDRGTWGLSIVLAVSSGGAVIFLAGALIVGAVLEGESRVLVAGVLGLLSTLELLTAGLVNHLRGKKLARPAGELEPLLVADLAAGELRGPGGERIAGLDQVEVRRAMALGSSAPDLELAWEGGSRKVFRGRITGGGLDQVERSLRELGLGG